MPSEWMVSVLRFGEKGAWKSLSVIRRDVQFVGSVGNDVIKIRTEEGSVFVVRRFRERTR